MYATAGIEDILGISAEDMRGKSFYFCVSESCLHDAIKCLENAKGNDSIAYLRFWFRDPTRDPPRNEQAADSDEEMTSEDGGVQLQPAAHSDRATNGSYAARPTSRMDIDQPTIQRESHDSRASSGDSLRPRDTHEQIFGIAQAANSSASSLGLSPSHNNNGPRDPVELEAVISCASDGLVVCLRKARPMIPHPTHRPGKPVYEKGLFAAPWANDPILPPIDARPRAGFGTAFAPSLGPMGARHEAVPHHHGGPEGNDFMTAIRDQAIFAWALTGINGALAEFGKGTPLAGSVPSTGLPVWENDMNNYSLTQTSHQPQYATNESGWAVPNGAHAASTDMQRPATQIFGDPGLNRTNNLGERQIVR